MCQTNSQEIQPPTHDQEERVVLEQWKEELKWPHIIRDAMQRHISIFENEEISRKVRSLACHAALLETREWLFNFKIHLASRYLTREPYFFTAENCCVCETPEDHNNGQCKHLTCSQHFEIVYNKFTPTYMAAYVEKYDILSKMELQHLKDHQAKIMQPLIDKFDRIPNEKAKKILKMTRKIDGLKEVQHAEYFTAKFNVESKHKQHVEETMHVRSQVMEHERVKMAAKDIELSLRIQ